MAKGLFREKSLNYISSPEQLNDYLKVTKPAVWIVLIAIRDSGDGSRCHIR